MRQRKVKNEAAKLAAVEEFMVKGAMAYRGKWRSVFSCENDAAPLFVEIGCGRGHFLAAHALANPQNLYLGIEGRSSIVLRALELIRDEELTNMLCIPDYIEDIGHYFADGEIDGIYLNFSDPWPKIRHAKRRLTHKRYLEGYRRALKPGGCIEIKTDNEGFFRFTLDQCHVLGMDVVDISYDLHNSNLPSRLITTQYEHRFRLLNKKILYCMVKV
ncbi:MAG: tRNA (guanosine(46)-N7)-methyltransferase TrmB [Anaerovoracaceae bacterium]|jgi:tRNA (guanine-N7-)-methyltransferase